MADNKIYNERYLPTGRILFIDLEDITRITPRYLYSYLKEGYLPVLRTSSASGVRYYIAYSYCFNNTSPSYHLDFPSYFFTSSDYDACYVMNLMS